MDNVKSTGMVVFSRLLAIGVSSALTVLIGVYFIVEMSVGTIHHRIDDTNRRIDDLRSELQRELEIRLQHAAVPFDRLQPTEFAAVITDRIQSGDLFVAGVSDPLEQTAIVSINDSSSPSIVIAKFHKDTGETYYRYKGQFYNVNGEIEPDRPSDDLDQQYTLRRSSPPQNQDGSVLSSGRMYATADGVVSSIQQSEFSGDLVLTMQHEFGIETRYVLSLATVEINDAVERGDVIGKRSGNSELSLTDIYEVRVGGRVVNPAIYIDSNDLWGQENDNLTGDDLESFKAVLADTDLVSVVAEIFSIG